MKKEIKIRIHDYKKVEKKLVKFGGKFREQIDVVDTYFNQPNGKVLKITEDNKGNFLVKLKSNNGGFEIVQYDKIDDVNKSKREFSEKFGVESILKKKRRFFDLDNFSVNINLIENIGEFLIAEGDNVTNETITETLEFKNPEFITVPFNKLGK